MAKTDVAYLFLKILATLERGIKAQKDLADKTISDEPDSDVILDELNRDAYRRFVDYVDKGGIIDGINKSIETGTHSNQTNDVMVSILEIIVVITDSFQMAETVCTEDETSSHMLKGGILYDIYETLKPYYGELVRSLAKERK